MNYVIGIDGGGTKTALKLADESGKIILSMEGGPCNINSMGKEAVEKMLKELIGASLEKAKLTMEQIKVLCIGTAGVDRPSDKLIMEEIIRNSGFNNKTIITNDAVTALYGGVGGSEGVILISGTGSICYGRNNEGDAKRAGGWGHLIGDEGSGYYIGINAINKIARSFDGIEEKTIITDLILEHLKLESASDLIQFVYRSGAGKSEIASLAKHVDEAYKQGDSIAEEILLKAAFELFLISKAVIDNLKLNNKRATLAVNGSVIEKNECVSSEFKRLMKRNYPLVEVARMKNDAAYGAVLMALDEL
ncbi:transcriptional regulator [Clostridium swellfunianum]|uniref:BadF/BadG/BcrA/BcrD ATPase family protein n=1 Tax=Clostridium swellfunianum TaxID=1367462 RepID=UPI0020308978|nr:BadF/BadG/BcrA/BcrD ATPase family protein [Clostridium swellfunianum]MCM0649025.1 transcriptional regulator [Clostridium swellfunianum]